MYVNGKAVGGMAGEDVWAGIRTRILLVAGESDAITRPAEVQKLLAFFGEIESDTKLTVDGSSVIPDASEIHDRLLDGTDGGDEHGLSVGLVGGVMDREKSYAEGRRIVKTLVLPAPASHALLYDRTTYHVVSGIMQDFLLKQVDWRLNLGWQLQYLNTSGKWDVKNLVKWKRVVPVSPPIGGTFAALKVLREVDEEHNPVLFARKYRGKIYAVIDISHENPVYNPAQLEKNGILYYKQPTVSKIPPTRDEARDFIALVDRLEGDISRRMEEEEEDGEDKKEGARSLVGVHCHYGYNRTGFLIVCYLVERRGYTVQGALDEFERQRPPGIRHAHFIDTLYVRYSLGLKAPDV